MVFKLSVNSVSAQVSRLAAETVLNTAEITEILQKEPGKKWNVVDKYTTKLNVSWKAQLAIGWWWSNHILPDEADDVSVWTHNTQQVNMFGYKRYTWFRSKMDAQITETRRRTFKCVTWGATVASPTDVTARLWTEAWFRGRTCRK